MKAAASTARTPRTARTARARTLLAAVAAASLAAIAACEGQNGDGSGGGGGGAANGDDLSPFTGLEAESGPVVAVKIDNAPAARPQTGLGRADIVYVEEVEGGLTRLVGIYASEPLPDRVGPVRSARESDTELLEQFGEPALAYSGVQSALQPIIDRAPLIPASPTDAPDAYERTTDRPAPYNLYADPEKILDAAPGASEASDIGFRFDPAPPDGGRARGEVNVSYPSDEFSFTWSEAHDQWLVAEDGTRTGAGAATVVVQRVTVRDSRFHDVNDNPTPYTETVGSGSATVLRDGRAYEARWERPSASDGTEFTRPNGEPMPFDPGPVWVVFTEK